MLILDPRPEPATPAAAAVPHEAAAIERVTLLHNGNAKFDRVAARLLALLSGHSSTCMMRKDRYGQPAPPAMLEEIGRTGAAVVGLAC
jgi:hypothetical protein